jgi:hypothetical protein
VDSALIGIAGAVLGLFLGGTGKYFTQRRDAWLPARAAGLQLLANIRALGDVSDGDSAVAACDTAIGAWALQGEALAVFRRGSYPSGLKASEWLKLATCFATLERLSSTRGEDWQADIKQQFNDVERLLKPFENDPAVVSFVFKTGCKKAWKRAGLGKSSSSGEDLDAAAL